MDVFEKKVIVVLYSYALIGADMLFLCSFPLLNGVMFRNVTRMSALARKTSPHQEKFCSN